MDDEDEFDERDKSAGHRRQITQTDADAIVSAASEVVRRRAVPSSAEQVRQMELFDAEIFGVDRRGGRFGHMEETVRTLVTRVDALDAFKIRVLAFASIGGVIAGLVVVVLEHVFK